MGLVASPAMEVKGIKVVGKLAEKAGFARSIIATVQKNFKLGSMFGFSTRHQLATGMQELVMIFIFFFISALVNVPK